MRTQNNSFLRKIKEVTPAFLSISLGTAIGFVVAIAMQKEYNKIQIAECKVTNTRRLVTLNTAVGTAYYCIPIVYLADTTETGA
jgi:hypothetical protein